MMNSSFGPPIWYLEIWLGPAGPGKTIDLGFGPPIWYLIFFNLVIGPIMRAYSEKIFGTFWKFWGVWVLPFERA